MKFRINEIISGGELRAGQMRMIQIDDEESFKCLLIGANETDKDCCFFVKF